MQGIAVVLFLGMTWTRIAAVAAESEAPTMDAGEMLRLSDGARGGGEGGLVWTVEVRSRTASRQEEQMVMRVKVRGSSSVAETLEPMKSRGSRLLQVDRAMWITRPGLKKPVPISPRLRLSGLAAIGDIAATNYSRDYEATRVGEEACADRRCVLLDLKAKTRDSTYERIRYWVDADRHLALKAEFLSLSGKVVKSARFEYDNVLVRAGRRIPFVSVMTISDGVTDAVTELRYRDVAAADIPRSEFDVGQLR